MECNERWKGIEEHYREIPRFRELLNYDKLIEKVRQKDDILSIVDELIDWGPSENEQEAAIKEVLALVTEDDYDLLVIAGGKHTWTNTVRLLKSVGYPRNKKALPSLILLLRDLNWPGTREGMEALKNANDADKNVLIPILEIAIEEAYNTDDGNWLAWIREFLEFAQIDEIAFTTHEVYSLLNCADW